MAQLVKLLDYVSRYEQDLPHYTTQFIRLKNYQWHRLKIQWEQGENDALTDHPFFTEVEEERQKPSFFERIVGKWMKKERETHETEEEKEETLDEDVRTAFTPKVHRGVSTEQQLRHDFENDLYDFQMKWASSTLLSHSTVHPKYERDTLLRELVQKLPDNYLIFYEPILRIKKAPVEMNILIMTPIGGYTITSIEHEDIAAFIGSSERFWVKKHREKESKVLNPVIDLNRNLMLLQQIFAERSIDYPMKKVLLSRNGYIDYPGAPYGLHIVDRRNYQEWLEKMQRSTAPFKSVQFRAADRLLRIAQTTASSQFFSPKLEDKGEEN